MYLILPTEQAEARNAQEAQNRNCGDVTSKWWSEITVDGETALVVTADGLTPEELAMCVEVLPEKFTPENTL